MNRKRTTAVIAFSVAAASLGACKGHQYAADSAAMRTDSAAGRVDSATRANADSMKSADTSMRHADSTAASRSGWTEPGILGFAWAANAAELNVAQLAEKKATNPKVKAYARELVTDHREMEASAKAMAAKLKQKADTTADNAHDVLNNSRDQLKDLTDKAAGNDWDKNFIDKMIDDHQKTLDKLQDASKNTTNTELRAALEKATGKVQQHLTKAQDIKNNVLKS